MKFQANENVIDEELTQAEKERKESKPRRKAKKKVDRNKYGKKFSARLYKYFTLLTFLVYYVNCMVRITMRCAKYFVRQGVKTIPQWLKFTFNSANWKDISKEIFDWYTITLLVFLFLYALVFAITFIRFSPKNKKTFKFFKKGFLMARRVVKLISVGLTLTVLINSATTRLATFGDKFLFVISLCSIMFTFLQICISVTSWIVGKKLNRSVKQYVGTVMTNYLSSSSRVRPQIEGDKSGTAGDKVGKAKDRFLRTIEMMTLTKEEAMQRDAELNGYNIDKESLTERFENDYKEVESRDVAITDSDERKKPKKIRRSVIIKDKPSFKEGKSKFAQKKHFAVKSARGDRDADGEVASDLTQGGVADEKQEGSV